MHLFLYTIFCRLYLLGIKLAALWNPKARRWLAGRKDLFSQLESAFKDRKVTAKNAKPAAAGSEGAGSQKPPLVWMHCASLGEFEQGRPVLEALKTNYPGIKILLTFFSPSGYEVRKNYEGADHIFYLPMDGRKNAKKFLDIIQPDLVVWIKYEYWYYYLTALKKRRIPALLVSGIFRKDQPFFKWYGRLHQYILESFLHLFVQTQESKDLISSIGFKSNVTVNGDTRFDRVVEIADRFSPIPVIDAFCGHHQTIVAGSTWPEDEEELDHYANTHTDMRFIIAPHEIHESHIKDIEKLFKHAVRYSVYARRPAGSVSREPRLENTLIIDNIGMLSKLYKYGTITYIGGGFGDDGVHNVLEAAVYGKPVVFGPVYEKYVEAAELVDCGGAFPVETALELEKVLDNLFLDEQAYKKASQAAGQYVQAKKGATHTVLQYIQENRLLTN